MRDVSIGYYAHHHGRGHLTRALQIARHLEGRMALFSSTAPDEAEAAGVDFHLLQSDTETSPRTLGVTVAPPVGPASGGPPSDTPPSSLPPSFLPPSFLHYAPLVQSGIVGRMSVLADWFRTAWPCLLVVDVSVEVALFARLCAVPTIYIRQNGERRDLPHALAYESASALLAPLPRALAEPAPTPPWDGKTVYTGVISRYANADTTLRERSASTRFVTVIVGHGGTAITPDGLAQAARATPDWQWTVIGPVGTPQRPEWSANLQFLGTVPEPQEWLSTANVVIGSAGDSVVAEMACLRCRYICIPEPRPFDEQAATAVALDRTGLAIACHAWPRPAAWPDLLHRAMHLDPSRWDAHNAHDGAAAAARCIETTAAAVWQATAPVAPFIPGTTGTTA